MQLRRTATFGALAVTACLALAGCSTVAGTDSAASVVPELESDQEVEIIFESYNLSQAGVWTDTIEGLLAEFEEIHPNITVTGQPPQGGGSAGSNTVSSVQTQLLAGKAPDVAQLTFDSLEYTATQLGAKPISDLVSAEELDAHLGGEHPFHPSAVGLADWDGKTYGMPYVFSTPVLFVNSTLLAEAGVPADVKLETWDDLQKVGAQVTAHTGKPSVELACTSKGGNWCMQGVFKSNDAQVLSDDRTTIEFGSPEAIDTVERFTEMFEAGVLHNGDAASQMESMMRGDSAFILNSSALQGMLMQTAAASGWELSAYPMPAFPGKEATPTNSGSALFVLSDDPAKQRAAWELIKFLTSERAYEAISSNIGYLPLRTSLTEEGGSLYDWAQANPLLAPNLEQLDRLQPWVSYPGNSYVQIDDLLATAIEDVVFYGKDATSTMTDAAERSQELVG